MHGQIRIAVVSLWFPLLALATEPESRNLRLVKGTESVLDVNGLTRVAVGNPSIVDVKLVASHQLLLVGLKRGTTTVQVWRGEQHRDTFSVSVVDEAAAESKPNEPAAPSLHAGEEEGPPSTPLELGVGAQVVLNIAGIQRVAIGDPDVCDVRPMGNSTLKLIGQHKGVTTLIVWKAGGARLEYTIHVRGGR
jgi:Flp pilus assembly secretin CpaC